MWTYDYFFYIPSGCFTKPLNQLFLITVCILNNNISATVGLHLPNITFLFIARTFVTEDQVSVPGLEKGGVITGPDPDINNKEFIAVLTINKVDKVSKYFYKHLMPF